ncbi:MAG: hypothetical protein WBM98_01145 [Maribacter sp.]|uniref:hypothetical protein n=1 Tax=Maribacter sp. TaxID=1897614 RepID=UPI003C79597A
MEVDKFEKHIKEELHRREINPSEAAWEKLSGQLPKAEHRKSKKFLWYGVAASFIGMVLIASIYFGNDTEPINAGVEVVDAPKEVDIMLQKEEVLSEQNEEEEQLVEVEKEVNKVKVKIANKKVFSVINNNSAMAASHESDKNDKDFKDIDSKTDQLLDAKIAEIVAQVNLLENNNLHVTDVEVDSLLRMAQQEILTDKAFSQEGKVDAMALLTEVEDELNQSFREQIFRNLKDRFFKARTAVTFNNN